jgi:hypothetical protein
MAVTSISLPPNGTYAFFVFTLYFPGTTALSTVDLIAKSGVPSASFPACMALAGAPTRGSPAIQTPLPTNNSKDWTGFSLPPQGT